jgi:hypothetical protein
MRAPLPMLTLALALSACQSSRPQEGAERASTTVTDGSGTAVVVEVRDAKGATGPFRLAATTSLILEARATGLSPGSHSLRFDILGPNGALYAQLPAQIQTDANGAGTAIHELQVIGTTIDRFRRTGEWSIHVTVDDAEQPLAGTEAQVTE